MMKTVVKLVVWLMMVVCFSPILFTQDTEELTLKQPSSLFKQPDINAEMMVTLKAGERVRVLERQGDWLKVEFAGQTGYLNQHPKADPAKEKAEIETKKAVKDRIFLMGLGMLRFNWTKVQGDAIRFRYSDLGLPADFSTRERASFTLDGSLENGFTTLDGFLNYDPENRISEPPLEFLFNAKRGVMRLSVGDYRQGVMADAIFSRYLHPFRGAIIGIESSRFSLQVLGGLARGESTVDEISADLGSGPYYLIDSPVLRGSEMVFLVTRSRSDGQTELQRQPLQRNRDYYLDYDRGAIMLSFYLAATDEMGNPRFLEVAYQYESLAGHFTRAVFGARSQWQPINGLRLSLSYLGDADQALPLDRILAEHKGILSFGLNIATKPFDLQSELSFANDKTLENNPMAYFVGAAFRPVKNIHLLINSWSLDADFPGFANRQLQYGYSLMQVMPELTERTVFLSPFQFTRNLGSELYPFSLSRLVIDERETHGMLEWEHGPDRISLGYGQNERAGGEQQRQDVYLSGLHLGQASVAWAKAGGGWDERIGQGESRQLDLLGGFRQRLLRFSKGDIFLQFDAESDWLDEPGVVKQTRHQVFSLATEYLSGQNGLFAGLRRETTQRSQGDMTLWAMELGVKHPLLAGFFVDSRYRHEQAEDETGNRTLDFLGLGLGFEQPRFRALARYEVQTNRLGEGDNRRQLWSVFLFGSPWQNMSLSVQYYKQLGRDQQPLSILSRRGEEQLNLRFIWRPWRALNLYSQWRYDSNLELLPPLDEIQSHSLASVQGLKLELSKRFEILANYKLLKVWGPIDNRKYSAAAELGYLLLDHVRLGIGAEWIDYQDREQIEKEYQSTIGYFKLMLIF